MLHGVTQRHNPLCISVRANVGRGGGRTHANSAHQLHQQAVESPALTRKSSLVLLKQMDLLMIRSRVWIWDTSETWTGSDFSHLSEQSPHILSQTSGDSRSSNVHTGLIYGPGALGPQRRSRPEEVEQRRKHELAVGVSKQSRFM
ncbi:hypothetical protein WMY93_014196 [Mugilogobius chulae]|uniref:Uncharacterized protein n=1 Tax=Mugilogobius chulae TaxID=88201 RepID=A0AAW0NU97_9GOBI